MADVWAEGYSETGAPVGAVDLGSGLYGLWATAQAVATWVSSSPERYRASTYTLGDPELPTYALEKLVEDLTPAELPALTLRELEAVAAGLWKSSSRWSTNAVTSVRDEYDRRGLVK